MSTINQDGKLDCTGRPNEKLRRLPRVQFCRYIEHHHKDDLFINDWKWNFGGVQTGIDQC